MAPHICNAWLLTVIQTTEKNIEHSVPFSISFLVTLSYGAQMSYSFCWELPTHPGLPRSLPCVPSISSLTTLPVVTSWGVCNTDQLSAP